jgi:hypothetical protein
MAQKIQISRMAHHVFQSAALLPLEVGRQEWELFRPIWELARPLIPVNQRKKGLE